MLITGGGFGALIIVLIPKAAPMQPQHGSDGTILNAAVLTAADVAHRRALLEKVFEM